MAPVSDTVAALDPQDKAEHLRFTAGLFRGLAMHIEENVNDNLRRATALRKLVEAWHNVEMAQPNARDFKPDYPPP